MKKLVFRVLLKTIAFCIVLVTLICFGNKTFAGSNPLTRHIYDADEGVGYFDLVVSLDWVPDQAEKDGRLTNAFVQFGRDVFQMTEGKQKIRNLYVFTGSEQMNSADIRILNKGGRSNANAGGIFHSGARILTYTAHSSGTARTDEYIGHTIAHEFGHYAYALFDEYAGDSAWSINPSQPRSGDNPRPTIMNQHWEYQWFSTASEYSTKEEQKTAQWRYYKSSAWETLVRNPKNDKRPLFFRSGFDRIRYEPFQNMVAPVTLQKPIDGWDSHFNIIWVEGNVAVLVIDKSGSMGWADADGTLPMNAAISSAKQFVDLLNYGDRIAVVQFDSNASVLVPVTLLQSQEDKNSVKAAIDTLSAGGGTDFTRALNTTKDVLSAPGLELANRYVIFMSDGIASAPNTGWYQQNSIPIYTIGLGDGIQSDILEAIAHSTGGIFLVSPTNQELAGIYSRMRSQTAGNEAMVFENEVGISGGDRIEFHNVILCEEDGLTRFSANWDTGNLGFELINPEGNIITPGNLPQGVELSSGDNYIIYTIAEPDPGPWRCVLISTSPSDITSNTSLKVTTQSALSIGLTLTGGNYPEPIAIIVAINGPEPVIGANVEAVVKTPSGSEERFPLYDDGVAPDMMENDGVYAGVLGAYNEVGDYIFHIVVNNPDGQARFDTSGALELGLDGTSHQLPQFSRYMTGTLTIPEIIELPSNWLNAQHIEPDNTPTWGAIVNNYDEVWYKFTAEAGTQYFIQTSSLLSWDHHEMATRVDLYDSDAVKLLESNEYFDGTNVSYIEWSATATDTYYIRVTHASPGTGSFALTVGKVSIFTTEFDEPKTDEPKTVAITVIANPVQGGTVTGGGNYTHGDNVTVKAEVNEGYSFENWTEDGTVVSTNNAFTFSALDDRTLVANFNKLSMLALPETGANSRAYLIQSGFLLLINGLLLLRRRTFTLKN